MFPNRKGKQQQVSLSQSIGQEQQLLTLPEGTDQSPKSSSSPSSPSYRDKLTSFASVSDMPRKISTPEESLRQPKIPPRPPSILPQSLPVGSNRQNVSDPTLYHSNNPPPIFPRKPKREPLVSTSSCNALPLPPKPPSTSQQKVVNEGPPLPPRESALGGNSSFTSIAGIGGPPRPPKQEAVFLSSQDNSILIHKNHAPSLPPRGLNDMSQKSQNSNESTPSSCTPPPVPPRGS